MTQPAAPELSQLKQEMMSRVIPVSHDRLDLRQSHLLNVTLSDYLPKAVERPYAAAGSITTIQSYPLPPAHHLTYFLPSMPDSLLLPDGTDPNQSPGKPFTTRMWAGGEIHFNNTSDTRLALDMDEVMCLERIADVNIKGKPDHELIFVTIERLIAYARDDENGEAFRKRMSNSDTSQVSLKELRNVAYMKPPPKGSKKQEPRRLDREYSRHIRTTEVSSSTDIVCAAPSEDPDYTHSITPNSKLLFRYSALTFNTHAIHRDPLYCRDVEGHRNLVFHGPLSLTFICTLLRMHLAREARQAQNGKRELIKNITYRNTHPLYCEEVVKFCGKRKDDQTWIVWVETPDGALAVTGTVETEILEVDGEDASAMYEDERELL